MSNSMATQDSLNEPAGVSKETVTLDVMPGDAASSSFDKAVKYAEDRAKSKELTDDQLKEFEQLVFVSEEELKKQTKADEIELQKARLQDLQALQGLMKQVHESVNASQKNLDEISKNCNKVIEFLLKL
jgi:hypothetical protein